MAGIRSPSSGRSARSTARSFGQLERLAQHLHQPVGRPAAVQVRGYGEEERVRRFRVGPVVVERDPGQLGLRRRGQRRRVRRRSPDGSAPGSSSTHSSSNRPVTAGRHLRGACHTRCGAAGRDPAAKPLADPRAGPARVLHDAQPLGGDRPHARPAAASRTACGPRPHLDVALQPPVERGCGGARVRGRHRPGDRRQQRNVGSEHIGEGVARWRASFGGSAPGGRAGRRRPALSTRIRADGRRWRK